MPEAGLESRSSRLGIVAWAIVILLAGFFSFRDLGEGTFVGSDEAWYAQSVREMLRGGIDSWIFPTYREVPFLRKPPLFLWLMAASASVLGETPFALRLPSALAGFATVLGTFWFVRNQAGLLAGFASAVVLVAFHQFNVYSHMAQLDMGVTFFNTLAVWSAWLAVSRPRFWLASGIACGLSVMTKSAFGLLPLPILLLCAFRALRKDDVEEGINTTRHLRWMAVGLASLFLVTVPWLAIQWFHFGQKFLDQYVGDELWKRFWSWEEANQGNGMAFYLDILFTWSPGGSVILALCAWLHVGWTAVTRRDAFALFVVAWVAIPLVAVASASGKVPWYIVSIYPALAVATGLLVRDWWIGETPRMLSAWVFVVAAAWIAWQRHLVSLPSTWVVAIAVGGVAGLLFWLTPGDLRFKVWFCPRILLMTFGSGMFYQPILKPVVMDHGRPVIEAAQWMDANRPEEETVVIRLDAKCYGTQEVYYFDRPVHFIQADRPLQTALEEFPDAIYYVTDLATEGVPDASYTTYFDYEGEYFLVGNNNKQN